MNKRKLGHWERLKKDMTYIMLEQEVYKRDNHCCFRCKSHFDLTIHHILSRRQHPELVADIDNMVVLCNRCHVNIHKGVAKNVSIPKSLLQS